jgi:hypothetical protein
LTTFLYSFINKPIKEIPLFKSDVVRIPPRRLEQLRIIGEVLGLSVADTIAHMIRKEVEIGTIPADIPGIMIEAIEGGVSIKIDDGLPVVMTAAGAKSLAASIRSAVAGKAGVANLDHHFMFMRRGAGYKLAAPFPGEEHSVSGDLALDIARLIEKAV